MSNCSMLHKWSRQGSYWPSKPLCNTWNLSFSQMHGLSQTGWKSTDATEKQRKSTPLATGQWPSQTAIP